MPTYCKSEWKGTKYKVKPLGWRRFFPPFLYGFLFYFYPERIKFSIEIVERESNDSPLLNQFTVYQYLRQKETLLQGKISKDGLYGEYADNRMNIVGGISFWVGSVKERKNYKPLVITWAFVLKDQMKTKSFWISIISGSLVGYFITQILCK
jgi:hypothetical protein